MQIAIKLHCRYEEELIHACRSRPFPLLSRLIGGVFTLTVRAFHFLLLFLHHTFLSVCVDYVQIYFDIKEVFFVRIFTGWKCVLMNQYSY